MKGRMPVVCVSLVLFALIQVEGWAQTKYVPKENEELYGTWINDKSKNSQHMQKEVITSDGWKQYIDMNDTVPHDEGTGRIDSKWTDSAGNVWYKTFSTTTSGTYKGFKDQWLIRISKSGTVLECVYFDVGDFDPKLYPTEIDPKYMNNYNGGYRIFYRAGK